MLGQLALRDPGPGAEDQPHLFVDLGGRRHTHPGGHLVPLAQHLGAGSRLGDLRRQVAHLRRHAEHHQQLQQHQPNTDNDQGLGFLLAEKEGDHADRRVAE